MYSVTKPELSNYASLGWEANMAIAFSGLMGGFALGCLVALLQGATGATLALLRGCAALSAIVAFAFIAFAVYALCRQRGMQEEWEHSAATGILTPHAPLHGTQ